MLMGKIIIVVKIVKEAPNRSPAPKLQRGRVLVADGFLADELFVYSFKG